MKRLACFALACLAVFISLAGAALAHKVSVFAFVDGDAIQVECSFSRRQKVKNGRLTVTDLVTGGTILEGITDDQGRFRFRPSEAFLATGHGLHIRLHAGEGHQDDWKIAADDLAALSPAPATAAKTAAPAISENPAAAAGTTGNSPDRPALEKPPANRYPLDAAELEAIIGRVIDAKLAPLKQAVLQQQKSEPGLRDIVGGIGWILGLLGLATYLKYRRQ